MVFKPIPTKRDKRSRSRTLCVTKGYRTDIKTLEGCSQPSSTFFGVFARFVPLLIPSARCQCWFSSSLAQISSYSRRKTPLAFCYWADCTPLEKEIVSMLADVTA